MTGAAPSRRTACSLICVSGRFVSIPEFRTAVCSRYQETRSHLDYEFRTGTLGDQLREARGNCSPAFRLGKEVGIVTNFADRFVRGLAGALRRASLPRRLRREMDLERAVWPLVRGYTKRALGLREEELETALVAHGRTREEKQRWTRSKRHQNVIVYGHHNTSDIFLQDKRVKSVYVELKVAKARSRKASTLPGDLQRSLGQSLLAHIRHKYVVCFIVCQTRVVHDKNAGRLERLLWRKHRIAMVVRGA